MTDSCSLNIKLRVQGHSLEYQRGNNCSPEDGRVPPPMCTRGLTSMYMLEIHPEPGRELPPEIRGSSAHASTGLDTVLFPRLTLDLLTHEVSQKMQKGLVSVVGAGS